MCVVRWACDVVLTALFGEAEELEEYFPTTPLTPPPTGDVR